MRPKTTDEGDGNIFWITMTDLMTGLVLVFIVMFFYAFVSNHMEEVRQELAKENANQTLQETLKNEKIEATVDPISGVVKISDLELFDINSYTLSPKGKAYLDKFAPAYFNSLFTNEFMNKNIDKIVIQGHTDSQTFKGNPILVRGKEDYAKSRRVELKLIFKQNKQNSRKS